MEENELLIRYPIDWKSEYRLGGTVALWRQHFPGHPAGKPDVLRLLADLEEQP
jgi:hypothetical protein